MLSQPLVSCFLVGVILGNPALGLTIGLLMELPFLAEIPAGGSRISMNHLGSVIAAMLAIKYDALRPDSPNSMLFASLLIGILISLLCTPLITFVRRVNLSVVRMAEHAAEQGATRQIAVLNYAGALWAMLFGMIFVAVFYLIGDSLMNLAGTLNSPAIEKAGSVLRPTLLAAGLAVCLKLFVSRKSLPWALAGTVVAAAALVTI